VAVTPDGRHVVSGSDDHTLRIWDLATEETKTTLQGHTDWVSAVAVMPDGRHVVSGSQDNTLSLQRSSTMLARDFQEVAFERRQLFFIDPHVCIIEHARPLRWI